MTTHNSKQRQTPRLHGTTVKSLVLTAIMLTSIFSMAIAFTGPAAAAQGNVDYSESVVYQGQDVTVQNNSITDTDSYDLRSVDEFSDGDVSSSTFITEFDDSDIDGTEITVETSDLEPGDYFVSGGDLPRSPSQSETFEVVTQDLTTGFEDDSVTDAGQDATTELDIDSNRGTYSTNVSADGDLDTEELLTVFIDQEFADGALVDLHTTDAMRDAVTINSSNVVLINGDPADVSAGDTASQTMFENALAELENTDSDSFTAFTNAVSDDALESSDETQINDYDVFLSDVSSANAFNAFAYSESVEDADERIVLVNMQDTDADVDFTGIDDGSYTFEFDVTDTEATSSNSISVVEEDVDGEFTEGVYQTAAGDIIEFELELDDTDEAWVQIGDEDAGFMDIVYVKDDSDDGTISFQMNTRVAGTDVDTESVYYSEDDEVVGSAVHNHDDWSDASDKPVFVNDDGESLVTGNDVFDEGFAASQDPDGFVDYLEALGLIEDDSSDGGDPLQQLTRPLQPTTYEVTASSNGVFEVDSDDASTVPDELDSATLELSTPDIGDVTTMVAPADDADEHTTSEELRDVIAERDDVALEDRLVINAEITGLQGAMAFTGDELGEVDDNGFAVLTDGTPAVTLGELVDSDSLAFDTTGEGIDIEIVADDSTGNQDPVEVNLHNDNEEEVFVVVADGELFIVVDTDADDAFRHGTPSAGDSFTASFEYVTDDDDRYEFNRVNDAVQHPFDGGADTASDSAAYPYFEPGSTVSSSGEFTFEDREIVFENVNADGEVQVEQSTTGAVTGETNVAPGSTGDLLVQSTSDGNLFRLSQDVSVTDEGDVTAEFDVSEYDVGTEFTVEFRVGSDGVDSSDAVIVDSVEDDSVVEDDDAGVDDGDDSDGVDDSDDTTDDSDDGEEIDDDAPGFGVVVALIAIIGAVLLARLKQ